MQNEIVISAKESVIHSRQTKMLQRKFIKSAEARKLAFRTVYLSEGGKTPGVERKKIYLMR